MRAFAWPFQEAGSYVKMGVLTLMWAIVIGFPIWFGYLVDTMKVVGDGEDDKMPNLEDFAGLLYKGIMLLLILVIFGVIPMVMLMMSFGGALASVLTSSFMGSGVGAAGGIGLGMLGFLVTGVVMMLIWAFLPISILRYASSGSVGAAFDFGSIFSDVTKGPLDYLAILVAVPVLSKAGLLVLSFIPAVGWIMMLPFCTYIGLVWAHLMGQYHAAHLAAPDSAPASAI